jgi:hypothetical protein
MRGMLASSQQGTWLRPSAMQRTISLKSASQSDGFLPAVPSRMLEMSQKPRQLPRTPASLQHWGAIHPLLNIILQLRILVLLLVSTVPYVVKVENYS